MDNSQKESEQETPEYTKIESIFVRRRNVLLLRGNFTSLYTDYYLHLADNKIEIPRQLDPLLKDLITGLTLHLVARPWKESIAWTVTLRAPRVNMFATGSSLHKSIVGRAFTEDVREPAQDLFYSQTLIDGVEKPQTSTVKIESRDALKWVEQYYRQSEQRPARTFRLPDESFALACAEPDFDAEWLQAQTPESIAEIDKLEETKLLETRKFHFHCGCNLEKILPILGAWREKPDELFHGAEQISVQCPRCAATYKVTREMLE